MIDLHSHTDQSDGTLTPHELVEQACAIGLEALAIADHDTLAGYDLALPVAEAAGLELLCAIELSSRPAHEDGEKRPPSIHLLGYFPDCAPTREFRQWLRVQQDGRRRRNLDLVSKLQSLGVVITLDEVQSVGRNLTGRPHFAQVLQSKGYVSSRQEAFDMYLADHAQAAVERDEPTPKRPFGAFVPLVACRWWHTRAACRSGIPLLFQASSNAGWKWVWKESKCTIAALSGAGGVVRTAGRHFGLVATGGSDFHGATKPGIALGLEAESIHIIREVAAEFQRPGDALFHRQGFLRMVRLAQKAFYPGKIPFPAAAHRHQLQVPEMIEFRDEFCKSIGAELIVHTNQKGHRRRRQSLRSRHAEMLRPAEDARPARRPRRGRLRRGFRRRAPRRRKIPRQRARLLLPRRIRPMGPQEPAPRTVERLQFAASTRASSIRVFPLSNWTELDVWQYIHAKTFPSCRCTYAKERDGGARQFADPAGAGFHAAARRKAANGDVPHALARLQPVHRRDSLRRRHHRKIIDEMAPSAARSAKTA
jgi:3',5'-nucleoside bisphosphate phosphatase